VDANRRAEIRRQTDARNAEKGAASDPYHRGGAPSRPPPPSYRGETIFLRMRDVKAMTGLGQSTLYRLVAENKFPKPVQIIGGRVGWIASEVEAWMQERIAERDHKRERAARNVGR
jgi:prophage regulatory protein